MGARQNGGLNRSPGAAGTVDVAIDEDAVRVALTGHVDATLGPDLDQAAVEALRPSLPVEVDCARVEFMDSTGVAFLARLAGRSGGRRVRLLNPPAVVRFLVGTIKITDLLEIVQDAE